MGTQSGEADVIVIGGGIAGVAAALRLKDRGLEPLVLEAESRVGGRMTTDRVNGFVIDRGVTLLGNGFVRMRALVRRLGLSPLVGKGSFSVGIQDAAGCRGYRSGRFEDLLFDRGISLRARVACLRFGFDLLRHHRALVHGRSILTGALDGEDARTYFRRIGGEEVFERVFRPGLNGPVGGSVESSSRVILMQVIWNLSSSSRRAFMSKRKSKVSNKPFERARSFSRFRDSLCRRFAHNSLQNFASCCAERSIPGLPT